MLAEDTSDLPIVYTRIIADEGAEEFHWTAPSGRHPVLFRYTSQQNYKPMCELECGKGVGAGPGKWRGNPVDLADLLPRAMAVGIYHQKSEETSPKGWS